MKKRPAGDSAVQDAPRQNNDQSNSNIDSYNAQAESLSAFYNARSTRDILSDFTKMIDDLPDKAGFRVLDLGCGSGRDAFWLAQQGVSVVASDGAANMLQQARQHHAHPLIEYVLDEAPALAKLQQRGLRYDMILMSAFLFHFDAPARQSLYGNLAPLLRDRARAYITLRHGPVPAGRTMYEVPLQELEDFARSKGGASHFHGVRPDTLQRAGVSWDHITLQF